MSAGSGVHRAFGLGGKGQAVRCQGTVVVAHTVMAGLRLTAGVPLLESGRRMQVDLSPRPAARRSAAPGMPQPKKGS